MKLLSFGEIIWDVYPDKKTLGGAPLNLAVHAALLGARVRPVSAVGDDALGAEALSRLLDFGVSTENISKIAGKETGKCTVALDEGGIPSYNIAPDSAYDYIEEPSGDFCADVIAFGTLALRGEENRRALSEILKKHEGSAVFADVNIREPYFSGQSVSFCLENATILKISEEEAPTVACVMGLDYPSCEDFARELSREFSQLKLVIITRGERGSLCYSRERDEVVFCEAVPVRVVSTVGAGDSFSAAFLVKHFAGEGILQSLKYASKISALVCTRAEAVPSDMTQMIKNTLS